MLGPPEFADHRKIDVARAHGLVVLALLVDIVQVKTEGARRILPARYTSTSRPSSSWTLNFVSGRAIPNCGARPIDSIDYSQLVLNAEAYSRIKAAVVAANGRRKIRVT